MRKTTYLLMGLIFVIGVTIGSSTHVIAQQMTIPSWVKNTALWWGQGQISDSEFIKAIQWMVDNGLIHISTSTQTPSGTITTQDTQQVTTAKPQSVQDTIKAITGEEPNLLGNVYVDYTHDFTIYGEPSDTTSLFDYQKFVTALPVNQGAIKTTWTPPSNNNAQCTLVTQITPEVSNTSILHTYVSLVCYEGKFVFETDSDGVGDNVITNVKDLVNAIVSQIPNNGE